MTTMKKKMDEERRKSLDDGYHAHLEDDFLHQVTVIQNGVGGVSQTLCKKEPGDDSSDQPEDEGVFFHWGYLESDVEDKPEQENCDRRLYEGPEKIQIGA
jgi:hypothetical protein